MFVEHIYTIAAYKKQAEKQKRRILPQLYRAGGESADIRQKAASLSKKTPRGGGIMEEVSRGEARRAFRPGGRSGGEGRMTVWIDLLIIDNFCADAALLYCAVKTVKGRARPLRILLAALFGTALGVGYTLFRLYYSVPAPLDLFVRYGVAFLLPLPAARFRKKRTCALCSLAFVGYMAAFAGVLTALFPAETAGGEGSVVFVAGSIPSGALAAGCVAFAAGAVHLVRRLGARARGAALTFACVLRLGEREVKVQGFSDTGNRLTDGRGMPVAVCDRLAALALVRGQSPPREEIEANTVNGKTLLTAFRIDEIRIYCGKGENIIRDVTVAVSAAPLAGEYALILPAAFTAEEQFARRREGC